MLEKEQAKRKAEEAKLAEDRLKQEKLRNEEKKEKELAALRKLDAAPKRKV